MLSFFPPFRAALTPVSPPKKLYTTGLGGPASSSEFWGLIAECKALRSLSLFNSYVFVDRPPEFRLPESLEELTIGKRGTVPSADVWSWFDLATLGTAMSAPATSHSPPSSPDLFSVSFPSSSTPQASTSTAAATRPQTSSRSQRRGRRERERAREKGKRSPPPSSTDSPSSPTDTGTPPESPPPPRIPPPTQLSRLNLWTDDVRWPFLEEYKLLRQGTARGVVVQFYRLHIVTVEVLEQTAELRRASSTA